jgi:hypothetical protein
LKFTFSKLAILSDALDMRLSTHTQRTNNPKAKQSDTAKRQACQVQPNWGRKFGEQCADKQDGE